jgi:hypothetical protein
LTQLSRRFQFQPGSPSAEALEDVETFLAAIYANVDVQNDYVSRC